MTNNANTEMTQTKELANRILGAITEHFNEPIQTHLKQKRKEGHSKDRRYKDKTTQKCQSQIKTVPEIKPHYWPGRRKGRGMNQ